MSNRRNFLKALGAGAIFTLAGCSGQFKTSKAAKRKPNIIYILADDLGYGDLSCYGQKKFKTPNIDRLAKEGMLFTDHYSGSTVCAPSRGALMTGYHTGHGLVRGNYETGPHGFGGELPLRPEDVTIAEVLKEAGYKTACIGKWGMGMNGTTGEPNKKGFDHWFGILNQAYAHHYYPEYLWRNEEKIDLLGNKGGKREQYVQDLFTEDGLEFIEDNSDKPFFIFFAYTTPHAELLVPDDSLAEFKGKFPETPFVRGKQGGDGSGDPFGVYDSQATPKAAFAAMITRFDRDVGRIMAKLKKMGIDKDTIVMFTSDNGPHLEGGADPDFFNSSGPLKGRKRDLYEGGIRVPMIARWPGRIKAGTRTDHVSAFWDVLPTCADIAGAKSPGEIDGLSFLPTLLGKEEDQKKHKYLYWEFHENKVTEQAVRMGNFKAVRHGPNKEIELYDLETDIAEKHNIAEEHPEKVKIIERYLNRTRTDSKIWPLLY